MDKRDLTEYSDRELSLMVFNEEYLYRQRHCPTLIDSLNELFIYTDAQLRELQTDLQEDSNA